MKPVTLIQILFATLVLVFAAFTGRPSKPPSQDLARGSRAFAADLYRELARGHDADVAFSPLSIRMAFALARLGAVGSTDAEIARVLHFSGSAEETAREYTRLLEEMEARNQVSVPKPGEAREQAYLLHLANAIWAQRGLPLRESYLEAAREWLAAGAAPLDFRSDPEASRRAINGWVSDHTAGHIEELLAPGLITQDTELVLTNALYFTGQWDEAFAERRTELRAFHGPDCDVERPFMGATKWFGYFEDEHTQAVSIPFRRNKTSMTVVVPRATDGLAVVESELSGEWLSRLVTGVRESGARIDLRLPRFSIASNTDLTENLRALGLEETLSESAQFGRMCEKPLYINHAVHEARVRIDEKGAEASAATALELKVGSPVAEPIEVTADRPFLFVIHERESGAILFVGRVTRP